MLVQISQDAFNLPPSNIKGCEVKTFISFNRLVEEYLQKESKLPIRKITITRHGIELTLDDEDWR